MNNIKMNRDIPRALKKPDNILKNIRKNDENKENYQMGGLVFEYLTKKKSDSKSKERQFGRDISSSILNNAQYISKNSAERASENHKTIIFPAMKKIQTNVVNNPISNERANSIKSVEKNSSSFSNLESNKINSKIIESIKNERVKTNINSLKEKKYISSSGNNVSKFNEAEKTQRVRSIDRKNINSCYDLKPVASVKNLIKIPSKKPSSISLRYNFSTNNLNSVSKNKNPILIKQNSGIFKKDNSTKSLVVIKEVENKENIDFNRVEKECVSIPTGSTLETCSSENYNSKIYYNCNTKSQPEDYLIHRDNFIKSDRIYLNEEMGLKTKFQDFQKSKHTSNIVYEINKKRQNEVKAEVEETSIISRAKNIKPKVLNLNNFIKSENNEENPAVIDNKPTILIEDIYLSLKEEEKSFFKAINFDYMQIQTDVNEQMRGILIDWIVEVNLKFKLREETLFLTVSIVDRFLSKNVLYRSKLQLLGVAAMFIACKFEEIYTPHIKDFVYITDNAYSYQEILKMEVQVLKSLNYEILILTPIIFFQLIAKFFNLNKKEFLFGRFLLESFLIDYKSIKYHPSLIACTTAYIVMKFFKHKNYQAVYHGMFSPNIVLLKECAKKICYIVDSLQNSNLNSVKKKFGRKEYMQVSSMNFS